MSTETANLIVSSASLVVMVVTLIVACVTLAFMVKNMATCAGSCVRKKDGIILWMV